MMRIIVVTTQMAMSKKMSWKIITSVFLLNISKLEHCSHRWVQLTEEKAKELEETLMKAWPQKNVSFWMTPAQRLETKQDRQLSTAKSKAKSKIELLKLPSKSRKSRSEE
jgi:hypothetical protein